MIPESFLLQLKQYNSIEDVVSSYVKLQKKGRNLVGLCPFHSEKTGSFFLYPQTQSYYCFGCGAGGDVITFIRQYLNLDYIEALKFLAQRANIPFPEDGVDDRASRLRTRILELNRETARFFHQCLTSPNGKAAWDYLIRRGRTPKIIRRFGLGWAPDDWDSLPNHLKSKGFTMEEMEAADLMVKNRSGNGSHVRFRNRVMFPIIDLRGNVIAFGGRALEDKGPKYLNSGDTPVFKKSRNLFALNFAKTSKQPGLILAEGYMDVIAIHQAGFDNAVATLGTSLTEEQARLLSQYTDQVIVAYDSDGPGQAATKRAINIFDQVGVKVNVLTVTGAKDPDEFIQTYGPQRFQLLLEGCSNALEFEINKLRAKYDLSLPDGRVGFLKEFCRLLSGIRNPVEQEVYLAQISRELQVAPEAIRAQMQNISRAKARTQRQKERSDTTIHIGELAAAKEDLERRQNLRCAVAEEGILRCLLKNPDFLPQVEAALAPEDFVTSQNREIYTAVRSRIRSNQSLELVLLSETLSPEAMSRLSGLLASSPAARCDAGELADYIAVLSQHRAQKTDREVAQMDDAQLDAYIKSLAAKKK